MNQTVKKVAKVSWDQVKTIAEDKMVDLNAFTIESAMKMVAGTARSMGITVKGERTKLIFIKKLKMARLTKKQKEAEAKIEKDKLYSVRRSISFSKRNYQCKI